MGEGETGQAQTAVIRPATRASEAARTIPRLLALMAASVVASDTPARVDSGPSLGRHQLLFEGWRASNLDLTDPVAVFTAVWDRLPKEVMVYPTENYWYWKLESGGREIYGNIRLASGQREQGLLSFGYAEYIEFPEPGEEPDITGAKSFSKADGVIVTCPDPFAAIVEFRGRKVTFRFNRVPQLPPRKFQPGPGETFVQRTVDESGFEFFLFFHQPGQCFFWVLNEESPVPDHFRPLADDVVIGRRTGFVFWQQPGRKILASVRRLSVRRNDYCDGPFDQLADNYADQTGIREWMERATPSLRGRIDKFGYFTDTVEPSRVAINSYGTWETPADALQLVARAKASAIPLQTISRGSATAPGQDKSK